MLRPNTVLFLGIWLIILGYLGIPSRWRFWLYLLTGVILIVFYTLSVGRESLKKFLESRHTADTFTQNGDRPSGGRV